MDHLVREIQAGQSRDEHFQQLFRRYLPSIVHFFVNRGCHRQDAEDLAQDVLLSVYRNMGTFRFKASFDTWLYRIMINTWKNALRRRDTLEGKAERVPLDRVVERFDSGASGRRVDRPDSAQDSLRQVLANERTQLLLAALTQLPPKMRQCVELRLGQGLKYREIADLLEVSITTVKTHLRAARDRLRPLLEEHPDVFVSAGPTENQDG